jgi:hypothetical protein
MKSSRHINKKPVSNHMRAQNLEEMQVSEASTKSSEYPLSMQKTIFLKVDCALGSL